MTEEKSERAEFVKDLAADVINLALPLVGTVAKHGAALLKEKAQERSLRRLEEFYARLLSGGLTEEDVRAVYEAQSDSDHFLNLVGYLARDDEDRKAKIYAAAWVAVSPVGKVPRDQVIDYLHTIRDLRSEDLLLLVEIVDVNRRPPPPGLARDFTHATADGEFHGPIHRLVSAGVISTRQFGPAHNLQMVPNPNSMADLIVDTLRDAIEAIRRAPASHDPGH